MTSSWRYEAHCLSSYPALLYIIAILEIQCRGWPIGLCEMSALLEVMAWCHQASNHHMCQSWPSSKIHYVLPIADEWTPYSFKRFTCHELKCCVYSKQYNWLADNLWECPAVWLIVVKSFRHWYRCNHIVNLNIIGTIKRLLTTIIKCFYLCLRLEMTCSRVLHTRVSSAI